MAYCFMNNSHNKKSDYRQMSPKDTYVKPKVNQRSLSIYEQYLKKTIENINQDINKSVNNGADTDHKEISTPKMMVMASESSNNSEKLLTVIGFFCTLLLLALVIILFNATDTLIDRLSAVDSQVSEVSRNISGISKENSLAAAQDIAEEKVVNATNTKNLALVKESLNSMALNAELNRLNTETQMTTKAHSMPIGEDSVELEKSIGNTSSEPAISYDTFKKESQTVVYRDSSN